MPFLVNTTTRGWRASLCYYTPLIIRIFVFSPPEMYSYPSLHLRPLRRALKEKMKVYDPRKGAIVFHDVYAEFVRRPITGDIKEVSVGSLQ